MNRISLCMIVRDEEHSIARCLQSVVGLADEIVIVDTGSTDNTVQICRSFGTKIYSFTWKNDFSAARNYSLEQATGEWILVLDADDELPGGVISDIRKLTVAENYDAYFFITKNLVGAEQQPTILNYAQLRLFRNYPHFRYTGIIHELIPKIHEAKYQVVPIPVIHRGYLDTVVQGQNKIERNISLIKQAVEQDADVPSWHYYLGNEFLRAGKVTDALNSYEQALTLQKQAETKVWLPELATKYAYSLWQANQVEAAISTVREALVATPEYTDLWFLLGHLYLEKRQTDLARPAFVECLRLGAPSPLFPTQEGCGTYLPAFFIGVMDFEANDLASARTFFAQSWEWNPDYVLALTHLCLCDWIEEKYDMVSGRIQTMTCTPESAWVVELLQLLNQSLIAKKVLVKLDDPKHTSAFFTCLQTLMSFGQTSRAGELLCQLPFPIQQSLLQEEWLYEMYTRYWLVAAKRLEGMSG